MKRFLATLAFVALTTVAAHAEDTPANGANSVLAVRHPDRELKGAAMGMLYYTACVHVTPPTMQSMMWTAVTDFGMDAILRRMVQLTEEIRDTGYNIPIWCGLVANKFPAQ
jgi:hypothetical protein